MPLLTSTNSRRNLLRQQHTTSSRRTTASHRPTTRTHQSLISHTNRNSRIRPTAKLPTPRHITSLSQSINRTHHNGPLTHQLNRVTITFSTHRLTTRPNGTNNSRTTTNTSLRRHINKLSFRNLRRPTLSSQLRRRLIITSQRFSINRNRPTMTQQRRVLPPRITRSTGRTLIRSLPQPSLLLSRIRTNTFRIRTRQRNKPRIKGKPRELTVQSISNGQRPRQNHNKQQIPRIAKNA